MFVPVWPHAIFHSVEYTADQVVASGSREIAKYKVVGEGHSSNMSILYDMSECRLRSNPVSISILFLLQ